MKSLRKFLRENLPENHVGSSLVMMYPINQVRLDKKATGARTICKHLHHTIAQNGTRQDSR